MPPTSKASGRCTTPSSRTPTCRSSACSARWPARARAIVAARVDEVVGYATGTVTPDGDGYIDFVAVDERSRGTGAGVALVTELSRHLLATAPNGRVNLTVQGHRSPARALYAARLGFTVDVAFRGHRRRPD